MDSATDTDSEVGHSDVESYPTRLAPSPSFESVQTDKRFNLKDVHAALQDLKTVDTRLLVKDTTYANTIRGASSTIVYALREMATLGSRNRDDLIEELKEITSEWFLSKLLAYRRKFLYVGILSASIKGAVVSWVDVILANVAMASVYIASGTADVDGMVGTLACQRENEAILAASQLPYTWAEMLDFLASNVASCASLRLSLRLVFAAYILHPQLSGMKPRVDTFAPNWLARAIRNYLSRVISNESVVHKHKGDETHPARSLRDRIAFAMILVLYAVVKQTNHSVGRTPCKFPYVFPQEVLYLIRAIIHPDPNGTPGNTLLPFGHPDGAQIVLLCWGRVVPWIWAVWNDTRFVDADVITQLTTAWICHADSLCLRMRCLRHCHWQRLLLCAAKSASSDAAIVVTQLLNHIATSPSCEELGSTSAMWTNLLHRSCWLTAQLLNPCHSWQVKATATLIKSMCCIFVKCAIEGVSLDAREALIEALTHIDVDELQAAIQTLQYDKQSRFLPLLENTIEVLEREVSSAAKMRAPLTSNGIQATRLVMNFLALCCNAAPFLNCGASVSTLLSAVAIYASRLETSCLSCHFLIALSSLDGRRGDILPNTSVSMGLYKLTWELALSCPRSDILMASCLASCVLTRGPLENLHTSTIVEIWDYLRDVLNLILTGHYIADEAPLSFLVAPTLCEALMALMRQAGNPLVTWASYSPWTKNLCTELRAFLQEDENTLSKTHVVLKTRLARAGRNLVQILEGGKVGGEGPRADGVRMECVYFNGQIVKIVRKWK